MSCPSDRHPWREPWSASPHAAGPRPWADALERAVCRLHAGGMAVARIAASLGLREDWVRQILRTHSEEPP